MCASAFHACWLTAKDGAGGYCHLAYPHAIKGEANERGNKLQQPQYDFLLAATPTPIPQSTSQLPPPPQPGSGCGRRCFAQQLTVHFIQLTLLALIFFGGGAPVAYVVVIAHLVIFFAAEVEMGAMGARWA